MLNKPTYRIQAVAELTGVPSATLRAWERRYGTPRPLRTDSRYRLYSEANIQQVRRMKELIAAGMSPSEAAELVRNAPAPDEPPPKPVEDPYEAASERLAEAAKSMDPRRIEGEVRFALTLGDALSVVERVFCPAMRTVGEYWEQGLVSVGHEHLASEIVTLATRDLLRLMLPQDHAPRVLLACFAEEQHVLPMYAAAFRFVQLGLHVEVLGQRTPPLALQAAVQNLKPDLVGISVTMRPPGDLAELLEGYASAVGDLPWLVGGAAAEALRADVERLGGRVISGCGDEISAAIAGSVKLRKSS